MLQPKKLLILGATGQTGQQLVAQALQQGHHVTALARSPGGLTTTSERLRMVVGDVADQATVSEALAGQDAVISALGVGKSFKPAGLLERIVPVLVRLMERQGVQRLIFTSAFGVGETWRDVPTIPRIFMRVLLRDVYADKAVGEKSVTNSALDWTIVYPTGLTNGPKTDRYRAGERLALRGFPTISRADLADFLLSQIEDRRFVRKGVLVSSRKGE